MKATQQPIEQSVRRMRIRGGSGLGDSIYVRAVAEHFVRRGENVTVCSDFPDVFIGSGAETLPFDRFKIDVLAHYTARKREPGTNQWQDICLSAKIPEIPLRFSWAVRNQPLIDEIRADAAGRPVVLVSGGRAPMARTDGFGLELLPEPAAFRAALSAIEDCFTVRIGKGPELYPLKTSIDLHGGTSVTDLLDLGVSCDAIVGQCSFVIPLAESFDKPLLCIWAARGMQHSMHSYIRQITPQKVLSKPTSSFVIDDQPAKEIEGAAREWMAKQARAFQHPERQITCDS